MAKFTLHNKDGDFMHETAPTIKSAIDKCKGKPYKAKVFETYFAPSPWNPSKVTEHGKEVFRNY